MYFRWTDGTCLQSSSGCHWYHCTVYRVRVVAIGITALFTEFGWLPLVSLHCLQSSGSCHWYLCTVYRVRVVAIGITALFTEFGWLPLVSLHCLQSSGGCHWCTTPRKIWLLEGLHFFFVMSCF